MYMYIGMSVYIYICRYVGMGVLYGSIRLGFRIHSNNNKIKTKQSPVESVFSFFPTDLGFPIFFRLSLPQKIR